MMPQALLQMHHKFKEDSRTAEEGFALPSVLFLVVILALVCSSILSLQYFKRQLLLHDLARKKAGLAAVNGITQFCAGIIPQDGSCRYDDGTIARLQSQDWGLYRLVWSEGRSEKATSLRIALLGALPDSSFSNALTFTNPLHQLIFAGTSQVTGDIETGQAGITTGVLAGRMSPRSVPVEGQIRKGAARKSPLFDTASLLRQIDAMDHDLGGGATTTYGEASTAIVQRLSAGSFAGHRLELSAIGDSVQRLVITGDIELAGSLTRRVPPLEIAVRGRVTFADSVRMLGLITLCSKESIRIPHTVKAEDIILYSQKSVELASQSDLTLQAIAPSITLAPGAKLHYPSGLISNCPDTLSRPRELLLRAGSRAEGVIYMMKRRNLKSRDDLLTIETGASVTGAVVCEEKMTLDGLVKGSVTTEDFYFYESPTHYYGWLREGTIDRRALPSGFLIPEAFALQKTFAVIDWL